MQAEGLGCREAIALGFGKGLPDQLSFRDIHPLTKREDTMRGTGLSGSDPLGRGSGF